MKKLKNKVIPKSQKDSRELLVDEELNIFEKKNLLGTSSTAGSGITLIKNEITDSINLINSLENRGIFLKKLQKKLSVKKENF